jgi:hypothetical protein
MAEEDIFQEFNYQNEMSETFDDLMRIRDDFGRLNNKIARACGGVTILTFFL